MSGDERSEMMDETLEATVRIVDGETVGDVMAELVNLPPDTIVIEVGPEVEHYDDGAYTYLTGRTWVVTRLKPSGDTP